MKLLFTPEALASYNDIKARTPHEARNALDVIKEILAHPEDICGKSEKLTGALSGVSANTNSRRGWAAAAKKAHKEGQDVLIADEVFADETMEDWKW